MLGYEAVVVVVVVVAVVEIEAVVLLGHGTAGADAEVCSAVCGDPDLDLAQGVGAVEKHIQSPLGDCPCPHVPQLLTCTADPAVVDVVDVNDEDDEVLVVVVVENFLVVVARVSLVVARVSLVVVGVSPAVVDDDIDNRV